MIKCPTAQSLCFFWIIRFFFGYHHNGLTKSNSVDSMNAIRKTVFNELVCSTTCVRSLCHNIRLLHENRSIYMYSFWSNKTPLDFIRIYFLENQKKQQRQRITTNTQFAIQFVYHCIIVVLIVAFTVFLNWPKLKLNCRILFKKLESPNWILWLNWH